MAFGTKVGYGAQLAPQALKIARAVGEDEQPQQDNIFKRSERSLIASGLVVKPGAGTQICSIPGYRTAKQFAIYRLDWWVYVAGVNAAASNNLVLTLGGNPYFTFPLPSNLGAPVFGTLYLAPNGGDVEVDVIAAEANASYSAALVMTRLLDGNAYG